MTHIFA
jgi:hypothetical protein